MSKTRRQADLLLAARYVDDELGAAERAEFEARLHQDQGLHAAVEAVRGQRSLFQDDPAEDPAEGMVRAPVGVVDAVMAQVRRLPPREELVQLADGDELAAAAGRVGRRLLIAASLLFVVGLAFATGIASRTDYRDAQAVERKMDELREKARKVKELEKKNLHPQREHEGRRGR